MNIMNQLRAHNKPDRNPFDVSENIAFTACSGALLPISHWHLQPGDKVSEKFKFFSRTMPIRKPAFGRIKEHFDFFFVPYSQIFRQAHDFFTNLPADIPANNSISDQFSLESVPYLLPHHSGDIIKSVYGTVLKEMDNETITDGNNKIGWSFYSPSRAVDMNRLLNYLGYGKIINEFKHFGTENQTSVNTERDNIPLNALPLLAYHKIYYDFYRNSQWENNQPHMWFFDYSWQESSEMEIVNPDGTYIKNPHIFDLHYANYEKDKFLGVVPNSQLGKPSIVSTFNSDELKGIVNKGILGFDLHTEMTNPQTTINIANGGTLASPQFITTDVSDVFTFSILQLREASAVQKWREISQFSPLDYKHQIKAHYGFDVDDCRSNLVTFIDGCSAFVDITPVVNNNLLNEGAQASMQAKGDNGGAVNFDFVAPEHGILMCIYHVSPLVDYNGVATMHPEVYKSFPTDFPIPELDSTGLEPVLRSIMDLRNGYQIMENEGMGLLQGYAPKYIDFKSRVDRTLGAFNGTLSSWVLPLPLRVRYGTLWNSWMDADAGPIHEEYCRFKVGPDSVSSIFLTNTVTEKNEPNGYNSDHFLVDAMFNTVKVSNMSITSLPY